MEIADIAYNDLLTATVVTHWRYRERRMIGKSNCVLRHSYGPYDEAKEKEASDKFDVIHRSYAKQAGIHPDNHSGASVKLADETIVFVYLSDGRIYVAEDSRATDANGY